MKEEGLKGERESRKNVRLATSQPRAKNMQDPARRNLSNQIPCLTSDSLANFKLDSGRTRLLTITIVHPIGKSGTRIIGTFAMCRSEKMQRLDAHLSVSSSTIHPPLLLTVSFFRIAKMDCGRNTIIYFNYS